MASARCITLTFPGYFFDAFPIEMSKLIEFQPMVMYRSLNSMTQTCLVSVLQHFRRYYDPVKMPALNESDCLPKARCSSVTGIKEWLEQYQDSSSQCWEWDYYLYYSFPDRQILRHLVSQVEVWSQINHGF